MANLYLSVKGQTLAVKSDIDKIVENSINYLKINIDTSQDPEWSDPDLNIKCILSNKEKSSTFYENNYITEDFLKAPGFVVHLVGYELNEDGETYKKLIPTNPVVVNIHSTGVLEADPEPDKEIAAEWVDKVVSSVNETINQLKQEQSIFIEETNTKITFIENKAGEALEKTNENSLGIKAIADNSANAIKGNASGSFIKVDDVSPIEHSLAVKVDKPNATVSRYGKNLFPSFDSLVGIKKNGVTLSKVDDYYILDGTATESANFIISKIHFDAGTYTISANNPSHNGVVNPNGAIISISSAATGSYLIAHDNCENSTTTGKIPVSDDYECRIRIQKGVTYTKFIIKPQLEIGSIATEYEPYKGIQTSVSNEDGIIEGLTSISPSMTLTANNAIIECEYNKDLTKYINQNIQVEIPENVETTDNKVTVIDETIKDDMKYPSAKAVYELVRSVSEPGESDTTILSLLLSVLDEGVYQSNVLEKINNLRNFTGPVNRTGIIVDQTYNPNSRNAQSGKAINEVIKSVTKLNGKKIVNFGDSIFGKYRDTSEEDKSISTMLSEQTGAICYNAGFGGCIMTRAYPPFRGFSMCSLADSINSGSWAVQEEDLENGTDTLPKYFSDTVEMLKSIDWNDIDIITIAYGVNDYSVGRPIKETDGSFAYEYDYYKGALRYSVKKILNAYPHIKIAIITPLWRWVLKNGEFDYSSDDIEKSKNTADYSLMDYVDACIDVAKELHLTCVDNYYNLGINEYNYLNYFNSNDGTHPNKNGRQLCANNILSKLLFI